MNPRKKDPIPTTQAAIGFAGRRGNGVVYANVTTGQTRHLLRVPFALRAAAVDREIGYAALTTVARVLAARGCRRVCFQIDDAALVDDVSRARPVADALVMPYVRLRCALNQLEDYRLEVAAEGDLAARARAEVAFNLAA
ncbi:MAG: hypothetical protein JOY69_05420 [Candidatus Eremiobacteraeota bacterium]|nr:hypothetical protein [Candidatus Eremiobacteraeota bacterium]